MTYLPQYKDLLARQNVDFTLTQPIKDSNNTNVDLTNNTAKLQIKADANNTAVLTLEIGSGLTLDIPNSEIDIEIANADLAAIEAGHYVYDWYRVDASNKKHGITYGKFILDKGITF